MTGFHHRLKGISHFGVNSPESMLRTDTWRAGSWMKDAASFSAGQRGERLWCRFLVAKQLFVSTMLFVLSTLKHND